MKTIVTAFAVVLILGVVPALLLRALYLLTQAIDDLADAVRSLYTDDDGDGGDEDEIDNTAPPVRTAGSTKSPELLS